MLRVYKPITHPLFKLHLMVEHLVCEVWCKADDKDCLTKIQPDFLIIVNAYDWLRDAILAIYSECKLLSIPEKESISTAFKVNNKIEELCNGTTKPTAIDKLPKVVQEKMNPLFIRFYEDLLERAKVPGNKIDYYRELYKQNRFYFCPCCGYVPFESNLSHVREAFDHYLPKSIYPFSSVNCENLVPLCYKCNSDRKKEKDPILGGRRAYYPFQNAATNIKIEITFSDDFIKSLYNIIVLEIAPEPTDKQEFEIKLTSDMQDKVDTWNDLFEINERYYDRVNSFTFSFLNMLKRYYRAWKTMDQTWTFANTVNFYIADFEIDKYLEEKFLKIPFMNGLMRSKEFMEAYLK